MVFNYVQLTYFCEAYRQGNLHRAAEELGLSRQALSKSLGQLETELGAPLFVRSAQGLTPTELAEGLYPEAARLCAESERLFGRMRELARSARLPLRIGATFSAIETVFALLPIEFAEAHPNVVLAIVEHPDRELERLVASGELEGALVLGPADAGLGVVAMPVHREPLGMLMRADCPLAARTSLTLDDLKGEPLLLVDERFKVRQQLMDALEKAAIEPQVAYSSGDFSLLVKMCRMGRGLAPLPVSRFEELAVGELVAVPFAPGCAPGWQIDFIRRDHETPSFALRAFMDYLAAVGGAVSA